MAQIHLDFHSDVLQHAANVIVVLPQKAGTRIGMEGEQGAQFRTLWLLHGLSDDHTIWARHTSIERYAAAYGIAVVMPNGGRGWYTDMAHGEAYYTYITEELPRVCRSFFRGMSDRREDNYVAGLSMGGYGALKIAFRNPDRYAGAAAFSGALNVCESHFCRENPAYWSDIFGDLATLPGSDNDVYALAARLAASEGPRPRLYLSCGTEDGLLGDNRKMHALLEGEGIDHTYREAPGMHNWAFWDAEIQHALAFMFG